MKKWICLLLTVVMVMSMAACGGKANNKTVEGTMEDLANRIIAAWEHPLSGAHVSAADGKIVVQTI